MQCSFLSILLNINFLFRKNWSFLIVARIFTIPLFKSGRCRDAFAQYLEPGLDHFVSFECGDHDVEDPEEDEDAGGDGLDVLWSSQFTTDGGATTQEEDEDGNQSFDTENGDREAQAAKLN